MFFVASIIMWLVAILLGAVVIRKCIEHRAQTAQIVALLWLFITVILASLSFFHDAHLNVARNEEEFAKYKQEKAQLEIMLDEQLSPEIYSMLEHYNSELDEKLLNIENEKQNYKLAYWPFYR